MPELIIIAGCNGSGKSTFASSFLPDNLTSFDYDKLLTEYYNELSDSEFRSKIAKDKTTRNFEDSVAKAIANKVDFCYETNFDVHPIYWAEKFKASGFTLSLIFFCLQSQKIAQHRIEERVEFKGHFVDKKTIDLKWKSGYKNFNKHFNFFDNILIVDNSRHKEIYSNILQIEKGKIYLMTKQIPDYLKHRLPKIYKLIKNQ